MGEVIKSGKLLLSAMNDPEIQLTDEEIELQVHKLTWLWQAATTTTAYVSAMNSGEISLLTSERLRPFLNKKIDKTT